SYFDPAFRFQPLRPRAADVVVGAEWAVGADAGGHPEATEEADQALGVAPEDRELQVHTVAVTYASVVAAAALGLERGVAEIRMELEQRWRLEALSVGRDQL